MTRDIFILLYGKVTSRERKDMDGIVTLILGFVLGVIVSVTIMFRISAWLLRNDNPGLISEFEVVKSRKK